MPKLPKKVSSKEAPSVVDRMGEIKAEMATLQAEYDELKGRMVASGFDLLEGELFKFSNSSYEKTAVNYKGIVEEMKVPKRTMERFTEVQTVSTVRVTAR